MSSKSRNRNRRERPALDRARAAVRLAADGPLLPAMAVRTLLGCSTRGVVRRIREGLGGVFLDGVEDPLLGWMSTRAAVQRFLVALAEREGRPAPHPT